MKGLFRQIGSWPAWAKVAAAGAALVVVGGGVTWVLAPRLGAGRTVRSAVHASARPVAASPSPAPSATSSPVPVASTLACRLPISSGQPGSGGFITFPQAAFTADPNSVVKADSYTGLDYDRAAGKWLPVSRSAVAPDGSRYAYWDYRSRTMQAVVIATGAEMPLGPQPSGAASAARLNSDSGWSVIEAADAGVYAAPNNGYQSSPGLWLFPWSGAGERQVTGSGFWQEVGGGAAWGTVSESVPVGAANTIRRLDLATGNTTDWFSVPGLQSRVVGFDVSGHPVIRASSKDVAEVWLVSDRNQGTKLLSLAPQATSGANGPSQPAVQSVVGDDKGIWLATSDGLYLSTTAGTEKVSSVTGQLGGGCASDG
jgi:hypothetical protein